MKPSCSLVLALVLTLCLALSLSAAAAADSNTTSDDNSLSYTQAAAADQGSTPTSSASDKCPSVCPLNYDPVCDTSGKVYGNACQFSVAQCKDPRLQLGTCPPRKCPSACPRIYMPVCDTSGKVYPNACEFGVAQCKDPRLQLGTCMSTSVCANVLCRQFTECRVDDRTGRGYCADVCSPQRCASDETCVLKTVQCFTTPCPPIATCVKKA